jgi:Domain of unknown function (DU1801)
MAEIKTKKNDESVIDFINSIDNETKRQDCFELIKIFKDCINEEPAMWGNGMIGFGSYHYKSERSKQEGDWPLTGFSPRKQNLTIYIMPGFKKYQKELERIGNYKTSVSCLYIKKLADIDTEILKKIIKDSSQEMRNR